MCKIKDEMLLGPEVQPGHRTFIRHRADHTIEGGICRPVKEGEPLHDGEVVSLKRTEKGAYEVETLYDGRSKETVEETAHRPAMVTSDAYRAGWDTIFGPRMVGSA